MHYSRSDKMSFDTGYALPVKGLFSRVRALVLTFQHAYKTESSMFLGCIGLKIEGVEMDSCMTAVTEHGYPYIDMVTDRVGVAVGGCGAAAKSSDEMGRIAALYVFNYQ